LARRVGLAIALRYLKKKKHIIEFENKMKVCKKMPQGIKRQIIKRGPNI
jgi:hypothetical protein